MGHPPAKPMENNEIMKSNEVYWKSIEKRNCKEKGKGKEPKSCSCTLQNQ